MRGGKRSCRIRTYQHQINFYVVDFLEGGERVAAIIAQNWCCGKKRSFWPPYKSDTKVENAAKMREVPSDQWTTYPLAGILY